MRFSLEWLKDFLETTATAEQIAERLVELGVEVEALEDGATAFHNVVVGRILKREQHPNADKLGVCLVDVGAKEPRQIVCGAANARDGLTVAVALEGACLPNGLTIKKAKLRGVESRGMICSARELGLGEDHTGIMELTTKAAPGTPFVATLEAVDVVFDVSITPNRADVLGVYGIARDLAAGGLGTLKKLPQPAAGKGKKPTTTVRLESDGCKRFHGLDIRGVTVAESPAWLKRRLEAAGLQPRNNIVDTTNYLMLTFGQPMHAYDADLLKGAITVRDAKKGEKYTGIGGETYTLTPQDIAICDESGVIGLGGILGGESTAVHEKTENIFLEVAWFDRVRIAGTGQRLGVVSDARYRFERGVDPAVADYVIRAAGVLMADLAGGEVGKVSLTENGDIPAPTPIAFNPALVATFGGLEMPPVEVKSALGRLSFGVKEGKGGFFEVTPPTFRTYMETPEDLVEEVLRLAGYNRVPAQLPPLPQSTLRGAAPLLPLEQTCRRSLAAFGYLECLTYSFIPRPTAERFTDGKTPLLELENPIDAATMSTLRPSLLPGLLEAAAKNTARSERHLLLAEVGKVFGEGLERLHAAALRCGKPPRHWRGQAEAADIFDVKADLFSLLADLGLADARFQITQGAGVSWFHPGRSGALSLGKTVVARFGEVHPSEVKRAGLSGRVAAFELDVAALGNIRGGQKPFTLSAYQPVERDMAFTVAENLPAAALLKAVAGADRELVRHVSLFDVYSGENIPAGKKSLAVCLTLQADDRTLTDGEINTVMEKARELAQKHCNAVLRDAV